MDRLDQTQFTFRATKDGKVFVSWQGRVVRTYAGEEARDLLDEIESAESDRDVQLALARITGNFKRGNERLAANHHDREWDRGE